jgi:hypothetical protein
MRKKIRFTYGSSSYKLHSCVKVFRIEERARLGSNPHLAVSSSVAQALTRVPLLGSLIADLDAGTPDAMDRRPAGSRRDPIRDPCSGLA